MILRSTTILAGNIQLDEYLIVNITPCDNFKTQITIAFFPAEIQLLMCFCHIKHHRDVAVFCHDFSFSRHIYSLLDACSLADNSKQKKNPTI